MTTDVIRHSVPWPADSILYTTVLLAHWPRPEPGGFCGMLPDLEPITDPEDWPAAVRAIRMVEPFTRRGKPVPVEMAALDTTGVYRRPLGVKLTATEREWLGATVTTGLEDAPGEWTIWSLGARPKTVHLVQDGVALADVDLGSVVLVRPGRQPELMDGHVE